MIAIPVPCKSCRREIEAWRYTPSQGGDIVNRVCSACVNHKLVIDSFENMPKLIEPAEPRLCWSCHDGRTRTLRSKLCSMCAEAREVLGTKRGVALRWFDDAKKIKQRNWKQPKDWAALVLLVSAQHHTRVLGRKLDEIEKLAADSKLEAALVRETVIKAADEIVKAMNKLGGDKDAS